MRNSLSLACLALALATGCKVYESKGPEPEGSDLIPICHNGIKTIRLQEDKAVRAHLEHGDSLGECP